MSVLKSMNSILCLVVNGLCTAPQSLLVEKSMYHSTNINCSTNINRRQLLNIFMAFLKKVVAVIPKPYN